MIRWWINNRGDGAVEAGDADYNWPDIRGALWDAADSLRGRLPRIQRPAAPVRFSTPPRPPDPSPEMDLDKLVDELQRVPASGGAGSGRKSSLERVVKGILVASDHAVLRIPDANDEKCGKNIVMAKKDGRLVATLCIRRVDENKINEFLIKCAEHGVHRAIIATSASLPAGCSQAIRSAGEAVNAEVWDLHRIREEVDKLDRPRGRYG